MENDTMLSTENSVPEKSPPADSEKSESNDKLNGEKTITNLSEHEDSPSAPDLEKNESNEKIDDDEEKLTNSAKSDVPMPSLNPEHKIADLKTCEPENSEGKNEENDCKNDKEIDLKADDNVEAVKEIEKSIETPAEETKEDISKDTKCTEVSLELKKDAEVPKETVENEKVLLESKKPAEILLEVEMTDIPIEDVEDVTEVAKDSEMLVVPKDAETATEDKNVAKEIDENSDDFMEVDEEKEAPSAVLNNTEASIDAINKSKDPSDINKEDLSDNINEKEVSTEVNIAKVDADNKTEVLEDMNEAEIPTNINEEKIPVNVDDTKVSEDKDETKIPVDVNETETSVNVKKGDVSTDVSKADVPVDVNMVEDSANVNKAEVPVDVNKTEAPVDVNKTEASVDVNMAEAPVDVNMAEALVDVNMAEAPDDVINAKVLENVNKVEILTNVNNAEAATNVNNAETATNVNNAKVPSCVNNAEALTDVNNAEVLTNINNAEVTTDVNNSDVPANAETPKNIENNSEILADINKIRVPGFATNNVENLEDGMQCEDATVTSEDQLDAPLEMEIDEECPIARLIIKGYEEDKNEDNTIMTVQEINDYIKEKVKKYIRDPNVNPLVQAQKKINSLIEEIEAKKAEAAKLIKSFDSLNKDHIKFLRHMGAMPKIETKTVGVGIDLEWLPETVSGMLQSNANQNQLQSGVSNTIIRPKKPAGGGPIECIDLTDDVDTPAPPKLAVPDRKTIVVPNTSAFSNSSSAVKTLKHPAPLPISSSSYIFTVLDVPSKPKLSVSVDKNGIVLQWSMPDQLRKIRITGYEIYGYQEKSNIPVNTALWKKIGTVNPMPLPMSCTLTQFVEGYRYHFSIRGISNEKLGHFSDPASIMFKPQGI